MSLSTQDAVRAVLANLAHAWNTGDAAAYGRQFTEDATYVSFDGHLLNGRQAIEDVHRFLFDGPLRGSRMVSESGEGSTIQSTSLFGEDVAVAVSTGGIQLAGQTELGDRESVQTLVLTRSGERWLVAAFQNTRKSDDA